MKKSIFFIAAILTMASCNITKRHYASGFHVDLWSKYGPISHPTQVKEKSIESDADRVYELQSMADINSDVISLPIINELHYRSEMKNAVDSLLNKDSVLSLFSAPNVIEDTLTTPESSEDYIKPKEMVNPKAAIGFGLTVLGILTAFFAPYLVFYLTVIGFLLSYLGYKEIKRHGGRGEKLAKWGMAIPLGAFALVIFFGLIFLLAYGIALA